MNGHTAQSAQKPTEPKSADSKPAELPDVGPQGTVSPTSNPKKFLFVSYESLSGDLAWQVKKEGHDVKVFIKKDTDKDVYDGFLEKVDDWGQWKDWADVIVFDDVGFGEQADILRRKGKFVVGGSTYTDKLEEDRAFAQPG